MFKPNASATGDDTLKSLPSLRPHFEMEGSVTAGNASGINDGSAAIVFASQKGVYEKGFKPMGRIIGWGHAGVEPSIMGVGPVKAVPIALKRAGLDLDDIDVIESNEAIDRKSVV